MSSKAWIRNKDFVEKVIDLKERGYTYKQILEKLQKELGFKIHYNTVINANVKGQNVGKTRKANNKSIY